ncbi:proteasome activator complex subunit 3-like isoform X2 [Epinephelus moara]|uniref:proteasome activator complex subunit 3-like isoform X2 n=1 Tax=Epinephelus moara TaxID=300413 RepID=UPI00214F06F2|nr:proteasome activator complex subunit 3-like isoform X2 [Epinephelus moara]
MTSCTCGRSSGGPCSLCNIRAKKVQLFSGFRHLLLAMSSLLKVDRELKTRVETFREQISSEAEHLVASFFPQKLLELDHFLKEPILNVTDLKEIHSEIKFRVPEPIIFTNSHDGVDTNTKKRKLEDGVTDDSWQGGTKMLVMPEGMLKCNTKLVDLIERVKPEIRTLIEKCNTVKTWVQLLIPRIEDGNNFGVSIQEDYRRTISEIDEKEYISLKIIVSELRNQYVILHDMILKNIEKIKKPRNSNSEALY